MTPFSVIMSVYYKDNPEAFDKALKSISEKQTLKPSEYILVVDGPVPETIDNVIDKYSYRLGNRLRVLRCERNEGLGAARRRSVSLASNELIAVMDSDDVAIPFRFERQMAYMEAHPECDVLGGQITEFIDNEDNIVARREVPCSHVDIQTMMKSRCPFNHMTTVMRRSKVIDTGNYIDWHFNEDYFLWIRMALAGCSFANLTDVLVNVRVGKDMYARRGGWKYFKSEKGLQNYMLGHKMISLPRYCYNVFGRFVIQVAMPNKLRGFIFQKLFRK